ncbi:MAG: AMP-binding protein [Dehalococcoidia bacterium]|nr:MAG: AMP-binding protein [Dehalococcoidia bacterium]
MTDLKAVLRDVAIQYGDKTALVSGDSRISYSTLEKSSGRIAAGLQKLGVGKGDRVAMLLDNCPQFVEIFFAIVKTGAAAVPLDTKYKARELHCLLDHCQPKVLFGESPHLESIVQLIAKLKYIEHVISLNDTGDGGQFLDYQSIQIEDGRQNVGVVINPEDEACILYTSGPALTPKGAVISHSNLVRAMTISADGFRQSNRDITTLFALPLHHIVGLIIILLTSICRGSMVVIIPGLSIGELMATIEREKATIFVGVPFIHSLIVKKVRVEGMIYNLNSLRICGSIGSPLAQELAEQFERYLGFRLINFYGLTESTVHITCQPLNGSGKAGSVGKALPGWEIRIVDDNGRELPTNRSGEVIARGPILKHYYKSRRDTDEVIRNGWLYTRDVGRIDEDGHLFLEGLKKDMIITKGQNIYPSDIEEVLLDHPAIADAAIIGIPDEIRGEVVGAVIVLEKNEIAKEQEIKNFCLKNLANFKIPKRVIFLDSLPITDDGRVDKRAIRKHAQMASEADKTTEGSNVK